MTLSTTINRVSYDGDGSTVEFPFVFKFLNKSAIKVVLRDANGVETTLIITTHYTLTDPADSGTVTMNSAPATGETLVIYREVDFTQEYDPVEGGSFPVDPAEDAWDKNVMGLQQLDTKIGRTPLLKVSSAYGGGALVLPEPSDNAGKLIGFSAGGDQLATYSTQTVYAANIDSIQNYSDNLATAVSQIGATKKTLVIDKANTITANLTVPKNIHVWSIKGCEITVNNGVTLTLNSYHADGHKTFNLVGTGTVVFAAGAVKEFYPEWWGAEGDGSSDDHTAVSNMLSAMPAGSSAELRGSSIYIVHGDLTSTVKVSFYGFGTLKTKAGENYDHVLKLSGNESVIENIAIDQSPTMANTGENIGLHLHGNYSKAVGVPVIGTADNVAGNTFFLSGDNTKAIDCLSKDAGAAGFKTYDATSGGYQFRLINCTAINFEDKGFVHNGNADSLIIDNFVANTSADAASICGILLDAGVGQVLKRAMLSNIDITLGGDGDELKIDCFNYVKITNCFLNSTTSSYGLFLAGNGQIDIENFYCLKHAKIAQNTNVNITNAQFMMSGHSSPSNQNIDFDSNGTLTLKNVLLEGATNSGIRLEDTTGDRKQKVILDNVELDAEADSDRLFSLIDNMWPGRVQLGFYKITTGNTATNSGLTGSSGNDAPIQRNIAARGRLFFDTDDPVTAGRLIGTHEVMDMVHERVPTGGAPFQWVCITSGTLGTLAGITGSITIGTPTLIVNDASDIYEGDYLTVVGAGAGAADLEQCKVLTKSGTTLTLDKNAETTVVDAAVTYYASVWKEFADLDA